VSQVKIFTCLYQSIVNLIGHFTRNIKFVPELTDVRNSYTLDSSKADVDLMGASEAKSLVGHVLARQRLNQLSTLRSLYIDLSVGPRYVSYVTVLVSAQIP